MGGIQSRRGGASAFGLFACVLVGSLLPPRPARAYLQEVESIEWLVADSDQVVRGRLVRLAEDVHDDWIGWRRAEIEVVESIKGSPALGGRVTVRYYGPDMESRLSSWLALGEERLVFLVRTERGGDGHGGHQRYPLALRKGEWSVPSADWRRGAAFFTTDLRVLRGLEAACANARRAAAETPAPPRPLRFDESQLSVRAVGRAPPAISILVPYDSDVSEEVSRRNGVFLTVPFDERLGHVAAAWTRDRGRRDLGFSLLRHFQCAAHVRHLKDLLHDREHVVEGTCKAATWRYPVREAAREVLLEWGVDVPPMEVEPHASYRPFGRTAGLVAAAAFVLTLVVVPLPIPCLSRATRTWLSTGRRTRAGILLVSSALIVGFLILQRRSTECVDELTFRTGGHSCWVSSYRGGIQFVSIRDWPQRGDGGYACFDLKASPDTPWTESSVAPTSVWRWRGFSHVTGTVAPFVGKPVGYQSWTVPLGVMAGAASVVPLCLLLRPLRVRIRRRQRRLRGRCLACGYDLRGSRDGRRCPECGELRPAPAS